MTMQIKNDEELAQFLASPRRILFVEDDEGVRQSLGAIALHYRCVWDMAPTGEEALDLLQHHRYSLVLLDVHLPGISGLDVFRVISDSPAEIPVCIMTGKPFTPQIIDEFYAVGWCTFARKPEDFNARFFRQLFGTFGILLRESVHGVAPSIGSPPPPTSPDSAA